MATPCPGAPFSLFPRGFGPLSPSGIAKTAENTSLWASGACEVPRFLDRTATRAGGGARGASRRRRGPPGAARRLPEDLILIRTVKRVLSAAQVRQNIVKLCINQGIPRGTPEGPTCEFPWENQHPPFRVSDKVVVLRFEFDGFASVLPSALTRVPDPQNRPLRARAVLRGPWEAVFSRVRGGSRPTATGWGAHLGPQGNRIRYI